MHKFIYRNKKTGRKVYSNEEIKSNSLELIGQVRNGMINKNKVIQK
ncbi:MAG: hypothetical protein U9R14_03990 [Patescibacteria group bacterium]|nr:hypothetical protein [Patescibacteria group bacterium]